MRLENGGAEKGVTEDADAEQRDQEIPSQAVSHVIHGSAVEISLFIDMAVMDGEGDFGGF